MNSPVSVDGFFYNFLLSCKIEGELYHSTILKELFDVLGSNKLSTGGTCLGRVMINVRFQKTGNVKPVYDCVARYLPATNEYQIDNPLFFGTISLGDEVSIKEFVINLEIEPDDRIICVAMRSFLSVLYSQFKMFYLHSGAIHYGKHAFIFIGPGGSGKTTMLSNLIQVFQHASILHDDMNLLYAKNDNFFVSLDPFDCESTSICVRESYPLGGIFFLAGKGSNGIKKLSTPEALSRVMSEVLAAYNYPLQTIMMMETVEKVVGKTQAFDIWSNNDPETMKMIKGILDQLHESPEGENRTG
jgi:hypothetical protein